MYKDENHNANLGAIGQNNKINVQSKIKMEPNCYRVKISIVKEELQKEDCYMDWT